MKFLVRGKYHRQDGNLRNPLHDSRSERRHLRPEDSARSSGAASASRSRPPWAWPRRLTQKEIAANPLIVGEEKMVPNITKVFRRNQNLYVTFDVYDARPDPQNAKARRVKVSMSLFNEKGAKAFEVGPLDETQVAGTRVRKRCR